MIFKKKVLSLFLYSIQVISGKFKITGQKTTIFISILFSVLERDQANSDEPEEFHLNMTTHNMTTHWLININIS